METTLSILKVVGQNHVSLSWIWWCVAKIQARKTLHDMWSNKKLGLSLTWGYMNVQFRLVTLKRGLDNWNLLWWNSNFWIGWPWLNLGVPRNYDTIGVRLIWEETSILTPHIPLFGVPLGISIGIDMLSRYRCPLLQLNSICVCRIKIRVCDCLSDPKRM
jgi:hypothetical protein